METKSCTTCNQNFTVEADDQGFYDKVGVPSPTLCSRCRRIRRLSWRNDFSLYSRTCTLCQKNFASIYAPGSDFKVLCPKCFHSDAWDPYAYGCEYDPKRSFLEQAVELYHATPVLGIVNDNDIGSVNCLYTNDVAFAKNCAMTFIGWKMENVYNSVSLTGGKDLCDCLGVFDGTEFVYDGVMISNVSKCKSVYWCTSCIDCVLCYDLRGCQDCFMSSGLRNKKYYFKNQQYSKEEYNKILESYRLDTRSGYVKARAEFKEWIKAYPRKFAELQNSVNCTGADMIRSKNTKASSFASLSEDSKYTHNGVSFKMCYDCEVGGETELAYECITPDHSNRSLGTIECWKNTNISYSFDCHSCANVMGGSGVKKGEYVVLNKRYSKDEYQELSKRIIDDMRSRGEYGEFFPSHLSSFGINETRANWELGLSREEALARGYKWQDDVQQTTGKETLAQEQVQDCIKDIPNAFTNEVLACIACSRNYRILPDELTLYRRLEVPIPDKCFFCRNLERQSLRGGYDLVHRTCDCDHAHSNHAGHCTNEFETFFTDREPRPIYCEECYQQELL